MLVVRKEEFCQDDHHTVNGGLDRMMIIIFRCPDNQERPSLQWAVTWFIKPGVSDRAGLVSCIKKKLLTHQNKVVICHSGVWLRETERSREKDTHIHKEREREREIIDR